MKRFEWQGGRIKTVKMKSETDPCILCEAKYIEDCKKAGVDLEGKPELPDGCWKKEYIRMTQKPHDVH